MAKEFKLKYDPDKFLGEQTSDIFRDDYPIHILLKPKNNGATTWIWKKLLPSIKNSGKKFLFVRNALKQCEKFKIKDYQPNWKLIKYDQTIVEEFVDEQKHRVSNVIGAYEGFSTIEGLQSAGDFGEYGATVWDEFIDPKDHKLDLDNETFMRWVTMVSNACRINPNFKMYMVANRFVGDNDILNPLGIYFENKNELQEILVDDPDTGEHLVQAIYIPMSRNAKVGRNIANSLAKFNTSTNAFYNMGSWLHERTNKVWTYERAIKHFNPKVKFAFKITLSDNDTRFYYFMEFYLPTVKQTLYYIKERELGDNIEWREKPLALDIGAFDLDSKQLDEDFIYQVWENLFNYKRRNLLRYDKVATLNVIERGISSYISLKKSY